MALLRRPVNLACSLFKGNSCNAIIHQQQERGTCIFRRMYKPGLYKKGHVPRSLKKREYVYILEEDTLTKPAGNMKAILTDDVEGLGFAGDEVDLPKRVVRDTLFPAGLAIYATPENYENTKHLRQVQAGKPRQSIWAQKTARALKHMNLPIPMNPNVSWKLNKTHIRVAFRNVGVVVEDECIVLPESPITEPQDIEIKIIVNNVDSVMVKANVYHHYTDLRQAPGGIIPDLPPVWNEGANISLEDIAVEHARKIGPAPPPVL